jgi:hypothetical protein
VSRLLLLSCSQRKRCDAGMLPAIERYDGPTFRLLRRYLMQDSALPIEIKILSAEYGLISTDYSLPYYDRRITKEQSKALHPQVIDKLEEIFRRNTYTNFMLCLGKDYFETISGYNNIVPPELIVQIATGGLGRKLSVLHDWLYGELSSLRSNQISVSPKGSARIRDIELNLTPDQILDAARIAITAGKRGADRYQSWYVSVDDQKVAPKWLVSQITGLPVKSFVTDDARRVLRQLGVEVKRV